MKHFYTFLLLLFIGNFGFGQVSENFDSGLESGYYTGSQTLNSGTWTTKEVFAEESNSRSGTAVRINDDKSGAHITTPSMNGAGTLTFWYRELNSGGGTIEIQKSTDGSNYSTITTQLFSGSSYSNFSYDINDASANLTIRILSDDNSGHLIIDDFNITSFSVPTCSAPTTQASAYNTTALGTTSATLNWSSGDGDEVLVVVKEGSAVDEDPTSGTDYTGNTVFGSGDELGTGNYAVYSGLATNSVAITGLSEATTYHVAIYEYNTTDTCYNLTALTGDFTTNCSSPSDVTALTAGEGNTTVDLSWTNEACYDEILVVAKETSAVSATPTGDGTTYTANATFGSGTDLGANEYVVYKGTGTSVTVTGLTNGTTYYFEAFARKATTWSAGVAANATPDLTWCTVSGNTYYGTSTTLVNFGTINKVSGAGSGYDDFTSESTDAIQGSDIDLTVNLNTAGGYTVYAKAWIDWNQDGTFNPTTEAYELGSAFDQTNGSTSLSPLTISVPIGATLGNTRMRVVCNYNSYPTDPCVGTSDGEIEDYTINVIPVLNNDSDSEVYASSPQVAATTIIAADATTNGTAFDALGFVVEDFGSGDTEPTNITTMRFVPGPNNTADWTDHIQGVTLLDGNDTPYSPTTTITDTEIVLTFGSPIAVADGTSLEFLLGLYLNETAIVDGSVIQLQIDESTSGFETDITGSGLANPFFEGDIVGNNMTIDVDATELVFSQQPSDTELNIAMSPAVTVSGVDANSNLDTDYNLDIDITSTGILTGTPVTATAVDGIATFATLTHTAADTGLELTADDGVFSTVDSSSFDITEPVVGAADLFFSEYVEGDTGNNKYLEIYNGTDNTITLTDYSVEMYSNGSSSASQTEDFTVGFPTTLDSGDVIVLRAQNTSEFTGTAYDSGVCFFNGNDTVVLKKNGIIIDIIGNIGCDPGSAFTATGGYSTANQSLIRNIDVCEGVSVNPSNCGSTSFTTLATEWTNLGTDVFSNLGTHVASCGLPTTYTFNGTWSPSNPNGIAASGDDIVIASGNATIDTNTTVNSVTVNAGAGLSIDTGVTLTTTNGLTLESSSTSYSSLILDGNVAGTLTYERHVNQVGSGTSGGNDLISLPLSGLTFDAFIDLGTPTNATKLATNGSVYGFGPYNNSAGVTAYENYDVDATTALEKGKGYRAATTASDQVLTFTGDVVSDNVNIQISNPIGGSQWNLIGNPYPSYLSSSEFLTANATVLDDDAAAIYGYNSGTYSGSEATTGNFTIINAATTETLNIAPGQGFLVAAKNTNNFTGDVVFNNGSASTTDMRTLTGTDDYIEGRTSSTSYNLKLDLIGSTTYRTSFYFNDNSSLGLDIGYDAKVFGTAPNHAIYSHLVADNENIDFALQSLNITDLSSVTIPLGVNSNQGEQISFSISETNLPSSVDVYLDDTVANTSTLLNVGDYTLTPSINLNGTGRFYLHVSENALSTPDNSLDLLSIYNNQSEDAIVITGQLLETTTAKLYDMQGRTVSHNILDNIGGRMQTIDVSNLNAGVYVIQLDNGVQNKTQKVIVH